MRAGKDNLTIFFIGWLKQKQVIFAGCSKRPAFSPTQPWRAETRPLPSKAASA